MTTPQAFRQIEIKFTNGQNQLAGILAMPATPEPCPAIILVHGSGPADRDSNGAFIALREHFATHGYAVLCYDKPGVRESTGDWTQQAFHDRALEVIAALHFLQTYPGIEAQPIGLCGGSQAGWVMPIAAQLTNDVAFIISISGAAVTVREQEAYRIEHQLRAEGFSETEIDQALRIYERRVEMIGQGAAVGEIMAMQSEAQQEPWFSFLADITPEDLDFFIANYEFDSIPFLRRVTRPFLGIWGALDIIVPVEKSVRLTRQALEEAGNTRFELKIFPQANHGMRMVAEDNLSERGKEFAPKLFDTMTDWLAGAGVS
jgi:uncharacterized protein